MTEINQNDGLFVGKGAAIAGNVSLPGKLTVEGQIDGEVTAKEIHIGETGKISGKINAASADVRGELVDSITVSDMLILRSTAKVRGTITYTMLQIEQGAFIEGSLVRIDKKNNAMSFSNVENIYSDDNSLNVT